MPKNTIISKESQEKASVIANGTQKKGQTKEQTKLIAAGIEKGIAQYKKQHKAKMREQDKLRKKRNQDALIAQHDTAQPALASAKINKQSSILSWLLLTLSWLGFLTYFFTR